MNTLLKIALITSALLLVVALAMSPNGSLIEVVSIVGSVVIIVERLHFRENKIM